MSDIVRMKSVEAVLYGVVKIAWTDGHEAIVDLRPVISEGEMFECLRRSPDRFDGVKLSEFGHSIYWLDDEGDEIDFGSRLVAAPSGSPGRNPPPRELRHGARLAVGETAKAAEVGSARPAIGE